MVYTEPNLSRKPRWSCPQPYLKTENYYSAKKIGIYGIIWEQIKNEQPFIKKNNKTVISQCSRMKNDKIDRFHIEI